MENKKPEKTAEEKVIEELNLLDSSDFQIPNKDPEEIIKYVIKILENIKKVESNKYLANQLSSLLDQFINKCWREEQIDDEYKAVTSEQKEKYKLKLNQIKEIYLSEPTWNYINNFPFRFQRSNLGKIEFFDFVGINDFKDLNLSNEEKAKLAIWGYAMAVERKNIVNLEIFKDEELMKKKTHLNETYENTGIYEIMKIIYERLVVEKGYNPNNLRG